MTTETRLHSFALAFAHLKGCCLDHVLFTPDEVAEVILFADNSNEFYESSSTWTALEEYGGGCECSALAVVRLSTGNYGLMYSGEDYTGHGCQCHASQNIYGTLEGLLQFGIDEYERGQIKKLLQEAGQDV